MQNRIHAGVAPRIGTGARDMRGGCGPVSCSCARMRRGGLKPSSSGMADVELHLNRSVEGGQAVADDFHAINTETLQRLAGDLLVYPLSSATRTYAFGKLRQGFALSRGL